MRQELNIINDLEDNNCDISQCDDSIDIKSSEQSEESEQEGPQGSPQENSKKHDESMSSLESLSEVSDKQEEFEEKVINKSKKKISVIFQVQDTQQVIKKRQPKKKNNKEMSFNEHLR